MKTMFRNTVSVLLLLPLLAGVLGISAREHRCLSSKKVSIRFFPEFRNQVSGCCCSAVTPSASAAEESGSANIDSPECCKTIRFYFKADFQTTGTRDKVNLTVSQLVTDVLFPFDIRIQKPLVLKNLDFYTDTGPPLTGQERVISFHQSKIPCPLISFS